MHLCLTMLLIFLCLSFCIILLPSGTLFLLPDKIHLVFFFLYCLLASYKSSQFLFGWKCLISFSFFRDTLCGYRIFGEQLFPFSLWKCPSIVLLASTVVIENFSLIIVSLHKIAFCCCFFLFMVTAFTIFFL